MYFKRKKYLNKIFKYLETEKLILLFGSRQVGKTILIKIILEDNSIKKSKIYINFEDIYDKKFKTNLKFFSYEEFMYENIDYYFKEYYTFGGYPEVVKQKTKKQKIEKLSGIIDIYLRKDIAFLLGEQDVINFRKIFIFLSYNISSNMNILELSNHLGVSRVKTNLYVSILEKSFLLHKVYPFFSNTRREQSKQPEFFLSDLGIIPIEVKINNRDTIPKIFTSFNKNYFNDIRFFIKTTTSLISNRNLQGKDIKILPYFLISTILTNQKTKNT